jgi:MFS family permease
MLVGRWLAGWLVGWLAGSLAGWLAGWLVGWLAGWLVGWFAGWLVGWLAGWLVGWLAGWLVCWLKETRFRYHALTQSSALFINPQTFLVDMECKTKKGKKDEHFTTWWENKDYIAKLVLNVFEFT